MLSTNSTQLTAVREVVVLFTLPEPRGVADLCTLNEELMKKITGSTYDAF